jgi:hypothetical protein
MAPALASVSLKQELHDCFSRLQPHVDSTQIALTGGVAIDIHARASNAHRARSRVAEDIDFVAESIDAVRPSVTNDFLVSHFHLPQPGYPKFLVQLVDPLTRLRVDVFPDSLRALRRAPAVSIGSYSLRVLDAETLLAHKLRLVSGSSAVNPVEEKHYADVQWLGAICGRVVPSLPASHLVRPAYSHDLEELCLRCQVSRRDGFPLAAKRAIFDVLGYV